MTMRIGVDEDRCCGAGSCVLVAPDVFDQRDEDGVVVLLDPRPPERLHAACREAASVCPAAAITVMEE
ncbi:ferredoxin [Saccharomonospora viridis]|nr:ferredoxin [Saccharomonospora viridis]